MGNTWKSRQAPGGRIFSLDCWQVSPACVIVQSERLLADGRICFHLFNVASRRVTAVIRCGNQIRKEISLAGGEIQTAIL